MKIIVFSDIHGNIYALEEALKLMRLHNPDAYLFLGDIAGYYYYQNECVDLLLGLENLISIKGNHDLYFLNAYPSKDFKLLDEKYGKSYSMLGENISHSTLEFLKNMQEFEKNNLFEAYHGSPEDYFNGYIYPDNESKNFLETVSANYLFLGNTHYDMRKQYAKMKVINPGSIGQPRNSKKPSFCVVDFNNGTEEMVYFSYDKSKLLDDIRRYDPDKNYLTRVLMRDE
ncbi:metallophosphoesterase family protein [Francisella philomiragia]|uniref:metallophosphoesterase family protein n=1 Tax=Francisella philomiragia TaxID=28110 RepID=UPI0035110A3D